MTAPDSLMEQAKTWADSGLALALATVVETWGSSPCPAGSQMVVSSDADFAGSVSGGCIETTVVSESLEIIKDGRAEVLEYGVSDRDSATAGLACGGTIKVLVEPLSAALLEQLLGARPAVRAIDLDSGKWSFMRAEETLGDLSLDAETLAVAQDVEAEERARIVEAGDRQIFLQPLIPAYRLLIIGAVRIAQALAPMATEAGFDVTVIDPRRAFATAERFPGVTLVQNWPDMALPDLKPDKHTALVTLTHDEKPDDMALYLALRSDVFYVGALGSRKTHAKRTERLHLYGLSEDEIVRIHAPVGLDIGARTPAEIAVSILGQVIAAKNGKGPLHKEKPDEVR